MTELPAQRFDMLAPSEKRRWYEDAFFRAQEINEQSVLEWLEPDRRDDYLAPVMAHAQAQIEGCTRQEAEEALGHAIALMRCRRPSGGVVAGYVSLLPRYPRRLPLPSLAAAISRERYHVLPAVGALVADAEAELERKRAKVNELRRAIGKLDLSRRRRALADELRCQRASERARQGTPAPGRDP